LLEAGAGRTLDRGGTDLAHAVRRETGGNPFFAGEILRHLAETGVITTEGGRWESTEDLQGITLPDSIRNVIAQRAARLGSESEQLLRVAAVIGHEFDLAILAAAVERPVDDVLTALEEAEAAALIRNVGTSTFTFAHTLIAHTLETGLTPARRAQAHRRIAEGIEAAYDATDRAPELARHWAGVGADALDKAIDYARLAGNRSLRALAPEEAVRWYTQGIDLLDQRQPDDDQRRCELLVRLGRAQRQAGA